MQKIAPAFVYVFAVLLATAVGVGANTYQVIINCCARDPCPYDLNFLCPFLAFFGQIPCRACGDT
jgi:hypothetical protein